MKITIFIVLFLLTAIGFAVAQSTATPIQLGTLSTTCSGTINPCWVPISVSNPLPTKSN